MSADVAAAVGVHGQTTIGTGVRATATTGTALQVAGRARFSRSGRATIAAGHKSVTITMAGVTTSSYVIATPQVNRAGVYVQSVVPGTGRLTIYLNKTTTVSTVIGYLVIN